MIYLSIFRPSLTYSLIYSQSTIQKVLTISVLCSSFQTALCGGDSVSAKLNIYAGAEGGNGTINCRLSPSGRTKFFCKDECEAKDILIKTDGVRAQSGRYSTTYRNNSSGEEILSVTITHLIKSDSGRYRSGLGKNLVPDSYCDFEVRVLDGEFLLKVIKPDIFNMFTVDFINILLCDCESVLTLKCCDQTAACYNLAQTLTFNFYFLQRHCWKITLVLSKQILREKISHLDAPILR